MVFVGRSGARRGVQAEAGRGLRWPDVDLDTGTLTIRRSISAGFETTPKSDHQRRIPASVPANLPPEDQATKPSCGPESGRRIDR